MKITNRDSYFDNLRGLFLICVIVGNSLEYVSPTCIDPHYFILFLYMFHMPALTFISGYFCKKSNRTTQQKVLDTFKIYFYAQTFYYLLSIIVFQNYGLRIEYLRPNWTLWYLFALTAFYIISDYIKNYRTALPVSIIISLILGLDVSFTAQASAARIIFFLPFFIAGLGFEKKHLELIKKHLWKFIVISLLSLGILYVLKDETSVELLFEYTNYTFYYDTSTYPLFIRVLHYIGAFSILGVIFSICTSKKTSISWIGKNSLYIYVSHAAIIQLMVKFRLFKIDTPLQIIISELLLIAILCLITYLYLNIKNRIKSKI
ncbi:MULTISPECIES: acyltransferase family protein [unclassified Clostridium]|uniref:acyltransferase family protein n=1 Tax=unclassified Clostridium TaxID=2614128 RepID=UPI00207A4535|nr:MULTISPECIES: acyltransferase family protein [unclassified Clostridium]